MKDVELPNEIKAVLTLSGENNNLKAIIGSRLKEEHFGDNRTKEVFCRVMAMAARKKAWPSFYVLAHDDLLSANARELITDSQDSYPPAKTVDDAEGICDVLERARKARVIQTMVNKTLEIMEEETADPDEAAKEIGKSLLDIHGDRREEDIISGPDGNLSELTAAMLAETKPAVIPTGFRDFDSEAGGLPRGGLVTLAASSGGGKSTVAMQIGINAHRMGYSTAFVSLEMSKAYMMERLSSNLSGVSHKLIRLKETRPDQNLRIQKANDKFLADSIKGDKLFKIIPMIGDVTLSQIAVQLQAFKFDVIIIDYINLLNMEREKGQNEASALGELARQAKVLAGSSDSAWVILAQLSDQGLVKYSRAIKEHSDNMLTWTYGDAERESHVLEIQQQKARSSEAFTFNLRENFSIFRVEDAGSQKVNADVKIKKSKRAERHPTAKPMPGLSFDSGDEDL